MLYKEWTPHRDLSHCVKCVWILENDDAAKTPAFDTVLPDACAELIIHYGDAYRIKKKEGIVIQPKAFLFGPTTKHIEIGPTGRTGLISVRFYPAGLASIVSIPVNRLTNNFFSLERLFGQAGVTLEAQVLKATTMLSRKRILEKFLRTRLDRRKNEDPILPFKLTDLIANSPEPISVDEFSKLLNVGRRHLERKFIAQVGMTPKMLIKIVRFQNVFRIVKQHTLTSLAELTQRAGYYDHSHFIRNFKEFAGVSPKEYFKEDSKLSKLFAGGL